MLEYIYGWIRQIAYYMVLVTVAMELVADKSYQKYIRLFTGTILILLVLAPVVRILGDGSLEEQAESGYEEAVERLQEKMDELEQEAALGDVSNGTASGAGAASEDGGKGLEEQGGADGEASGAVRIEVGEIQIGR